MRKNVLKVSIFTLLGALLVGCSQESYIQTQEEEIENQVMVYQQKREEIIQENEEVINFFEEQKEYMFPHNDYDRNTSKLITRYLEGAGYNYYESTKEERIAFKEALEKHFGEDIGTFITENAEISDKEVSFRSKRFGDLIVTVATQKNPNESEIVVEEAMEDEPYYIELNFVTKKVKEDQSFYQNILKKMESENFILTNFSVGEKEMLEISNLAYIAQGQRVYDQLDDVVYKIDPKVSYRIYTYQEDVEKVRVIINKQRGLEMTEKDLAPFYEALRLLGVENTEEVIDQKLLLMINEDQLGTKKGKISDLHYQYKGQKENEEFNTKTIIEIVLW